MVGYSQMPCERKLQNIYILNFNFPKLINCSFNTPHIEYSFLSVRYSASDY